MKESLRILKEVFQYDSFRGKQEEVIDQILSDENTHTVAVMPTGAGKSLLYQIPSQLVDGATLVISPLIALMTDQVNQLKALGVGAECLHSDMGAKETNAAIDNIKSGNAKLIYLSPERVCNPRFISIMESIDVEIIAVDEAHCISHWGNNFRPSYRRIYQAIDALNPKKIIALTATATSRVRADITKSLKLDESKLKVYVSGFYRDDLNVSVERVNPSKWDEVSTYVDKILDYYEEGEAGIVYCITKKLAEAVTDALKKCQIPAFTYHADVNKKDKKNILNVWQDVGGIVVATSAFGMGINKSNVRFVINLGIPDCMEEWYQMIGRGSRDGLGAECILITTPKDLYVREFLVNLCYPDIDDVLKMKEWIEKKTSKFGTTEIKMTQTRMAEEAGLSNVRMGSGCYSVLSRKGMIKKIHNGHYKLIKKETSIDRQKYIEYQKEQHEMYKLVYNMAKDKTVCRMKQLCGYFGEVVHKDCGRCDNCKDK